MAYHSWLPWACEDPETGAAPMGLSVRASGASGGALAPRGRRFAGWRGGWWMWQAELGEAYSRVDVAMRPLATGMIVVLRPRVPFSFTLRLTSYALCGGGAAAEWNAGRILHSEDGGFVALRTLGGWDGVDAAALPPELHPEAAESAALVATASQASGQLLTGTWRPSCTTAAAPRRRRSPASAGSRRARWGPRAASASAWRTGSGSRWTSAPARAC
ncbi:unnamed protein product [Prorocentrum cordatum]|uniref:Uncharacterized protein n=1 Tax=Prorocentrum cordatum TaxID=2364126 RepID=A0ABN9T0N3_9DINO|nr:unnamed protein product [Polarella glacialis]